MMQSSSTPDTHNLQSEPPRFDERSAAHHRTSRSPLLLLFATLCAVGLSFFATPEHALAQLRNFRTPPLIFPDVESSEEEAGALPESVNARRKVIVDFDAGVDDAAALIWLLSQDRYDVNVKGIVVTAGNVTAEQGVDNTLLLLDWLDLAKKKTPKVYKGGTPPPNRPLSLAQWFIHGPDGLWFTESYFEPPTGIPEPISGASFYCAEKTLEAGMLVIALGPLTTIAEALSTCPGRWNGVEIINVGGSRFQPSQTPVTEYNHWQNPEAAAKVLDSVLDSGATIQLVLADAFSQFTIVPSDLRQIDRRGNAAIKSLLPALQAYVDGFARGGEAAALADVAGVIYALDNRLGSPHLALVHPLAGDEIPEDVRGQTIIGFSLNDHVAMLSTSEEINEIAMKAFDPTINPPFDVNAAVGEILSREADNADVVTDIDARRMHHIFMQGIRAGIISATSEDSEELNEMGDYENHMYVPLVSD